MTKRQEFVRFKSPTLPLFKKKKKKKKERYVNYNHHHNNNDGGGDAAVAVASAAADDNNDVNNDGDDDYDNKDTTTTNDNDNDANDFLQPLDSATNCSQHKITFNRQSAYHARHVVFNVQVNIISSL